MTNSFIFFGLLALPLIVFLIWVIKQDKKRNYVGLILLIIGIIMATYSIVTLDKKYTQPNGQTAPKASSFR